MDEKQKQLQMSLILFIVTILISMSVCYYLKLNLNNGSLAPSKKDSVRSNRSAKRNVDFILDDDVDEESG